MVSGSSFYGEGVWAPGVHSGDSSEPASTPPAPPSATPQSNAPRSQDPNHVSPAGTNDAHSWGRPSSWGWNGYWDNASWRGWSWHGSSWDNTGHGDGWRRSSWDTTATSGDTSSRSGDDHVEENPSQDTGGDEAARTKAPTTSPTTTSFTRSAGTSTAYPRETFGTATMASSGGNDEGGKGPSERLVVPSFSGETESEDGDIGVSARSYLRQVIAWRKMTRLAKDKQALVLYQHLSSKAWVEAENLDVDKLASEDGVEYFMQWVRDRYLDVQVTQVGRSLSEFFRRLRKKPGQAIRDYVGEFDRAHARLMEAGCTLPDIAAAWVFVDRMQLEESAELNLLASVGNIYDLRMLQRAAIVQDRALRKPWENGGKGSGKNNKGEWWKSRTRNVYHTDFDQNDDYDFQEHDNDGGDHDEDEAPVPEEVAEELYEAYMTHETAKAKYRDMAKARGTDPSQLRKISEEKLRLAKSRSFCAGCKRKGHWHRDPECPLNQGKNGGTTASSTTAGTSGPGQGPSVKNSYQCHVVHMTWDLNEKTSEDLMAITDTACSRSVAGGPWLERYLQVLDKKGGKAVFVNGAEKFRFGASKVFESRYSVIIGFALGQNVIFVKTAIVEGDVPLLLSKPSLGAMGMIFDVAQNVADFTALSLKAFPLLVTETGHPAIPLVPAPTEVRPGQAHQWSAEAPEIKIVPLSAQYGAVHEVHMLQVHSYEPPHAGELDKGLIGNSGTKIFYPKKISIAVHNMLSMTGFCEQSFSLWWKDTNISQDFWIETTNSLIRVHVVPRRTFFNPLAWSTQNQAHKEALMGSLGSVRSIWGIACGSHRGLSPVHGPWRQDDHGTYPVLWIGKTVFSRRPMLPSCVPSSHRDHGAASAHPTSQGEALEHVQDGAAGRGHEGGTSCPSPMDPRRNSIGGAGAPCCHGLSESGSQLEGAGVNVPASAEDHGGEAWDNRAREGHAWTPHASDPRGGRECRGDDSSLREIQGLALPGSSGTISPVECGGNLQECEHLRKMANYARAKFAKQTSWQPTMPYWMDPEVNSMVPYPGTSDASSEWSRVSAAAASSSATATMATPKRGYPKAKANVERTEPKAKGTPETTERTSTRRTRGPRRRSTS